ncbi:hypothetical protein RRG08_060396 [Elysia crispata]|uniref:Uncharacterized protein n=1 Tax=Elysia crispata TaxID=231223 RepID=A0AAE1DGJ1_9GAST|nr:hypothetical protein RRG08_060396 [Elysia crispata]
MIRACQPVIRPASCYLTESGFRSELVQRVITSAACCLTESGFRSELVQTDIAFSCVIRAGSDGHRLQFCGFSQSLALDQSWFSLTSPSVVWFLTKPGFRSELVQPVIDICCMLSHRVWIKIRASSACH